MAKDTSRKPIKDPKQAGFFYNADEVNSLIKLSESSLFTSPAKSLELAFQALDISLGINSNRHIAYSLKNLGNIYFGLKDFNRALEYRLQAHEKFEEAANPEEQVNALNGIGNVYRKWNKLDKALEYYQRALKISKELNNDENVASSLNSIGIIYDNRGRYDKALEFYSKALKIRESLNDTAGTAGILDNIGIVHDRLGEYETALEYYQRSLELNETSENKKGIAASLINIGITFYNLKKYDTALGYIEKSLKFSEELEDKEGVIYALFNIGNIYRYNDKPDKALNFLRKGLNAAKEINSKRIMQHIYKMITEIYNERQDYKNAFKYSELYSNMREQVYIEENNTRIAELQSRVEIEKKEKEIELLRKERNLQQQKYNYIEETKKILVEKNKQIEHQNEELKELNATKDKFFSIIAHDLRNPFNSMITLSEMLLKEYKEMSDEEKMMWIKDIEHSSKNSYHLLENLLKWSMSQTDRLKFTPVKIDMQHIAHDTVELLTLSARKKKINLSHSIPEGTFVKADEEMIKTVLRNLVTNAIKFTDEKGEIKISCGIKDDEVITTVSDTGVGISKESIKKLFKIEKSHKSYGTKKEPGSGLGLILCKEFIEKNGGEIYAESVQGKGSKFKFTLPRG